MPGADRIARPAADARGHAPEAERTSTELALAETAPWLARRILNAALAEWGLGHLVDSADLVTSELVTNAVRHGKEPARLTVYTDRAADGGLLFIEVEDAGVDVPEMRDADDGDEDGRGLMIVEAMSEDWGTDITDEGKRVWASLEIGAGRGRR
jgi:anti-sigma regulatory factor (Ser/Thr protein kinase)